MSAGIETAHHIRAVAFDLDGTLVDSAPDIAAALNGALAEAGFAAFDLGTVRRWIGDGPDVLIARALAQAGLAQPPENLRLQLRRGFDAHTLAAPLAHGFVYPGVLELLQALKGVFPMAVVTNKPTVLARAVLADAKLLPFVTSVNGADTHELRKPAAGMLRNAAGQLGVACENLLMVGDSAPDLNAALNAECPAAIVAWGYGGEGIPANAPAWRIHSPQQLQDLLLGARQPA